MGSSAERLEFFRGEIMKIGMAVRAMVLVGLMAVGAHAQTAENAKRNDSTAGDTSQLTAANNSTYVIGPEDGLHIAVWKEADLTASLPVRPDGKISLPLLNDVQASGLTP